MKKLRLLLLLFSPTLVHAQMAQDWGAFQKSISVKAYQGKKFRLQAAVKVKLIDSTADAEIWARVDRPNKEMGFFYNMMDKPIRCSEWKLFTINGMIADDALYLAFGGLYNRKGMFYFDDFKLSIKNENNKWEDVAIDEGGFEGDSGQVKKSWGFLQERSGIVVGTTQNEAYSGKQSFLADASHFTPVKTYGNNDSTGHYTEVNGIKMYYEIYGQGQPLVLLHGNSGSISSYYKQIPAFSKSFRVIAIDSRGQGKSTEDGRKFTYELFAEDTKALLDKLGLDSVDILGWSDGGNIGLIMAMRYPQKVKCLAVMGANLFNNDSSVKPWVNKELKKQYQEIKGESTFNALFRKRMIELLMYEPKIDPANLQKIQCPSLVMAGSNDLLLESHTKLIAAGIKNSELLLFTNGSHYEPLERPERFNRAVLDFFQKH